MTSIVQPLALLAACSICLNYDAPAPASGADDAPDRLQRIAPKCSPGQCDVALTHVATLTDKTQLRILPDHSFFVIQDRSGRFFTIARKRDQIVVFDSAGRIESVVGSRGKGHGEFLRITSLLPGPGAALSAYDAQLRRLTVIGPDLEVKTVEPAPYRPDLILGDGSMIVAQHIPTPELIGYPIHHVGPLGRVLGSFGADTPEFRMDQRLITDRIIAPGRDGTVWAASPGRYALEHWDPVAGKKLGQVVVVSSWFKESPSLGNDERVRPMPIIEALWHNEGLLWVLLRDADANWRPPVLANVERAFDLDESRPYLRLGPGSD